MNLKLIGIHYRFLLLNLFAKFAKNNQSLDSYETKIKVIQLINKSQRKNIFANHELRIFFAEC